MTLLTLTVDEHLEHQDAYDGYCRSCGAFTDGGVEPDARAYHCDNCDADDVYGIEELVFMGEIDIVIG